MRKSLRPRITTPDGRVFYGCWPQTMRPNNETPYAIALAERVSGVLEVVLPVGRADVATDKAVFEVEHVKTWREGARQAFAYGAMSGLQPSLALFGQNGYLDLYLRIRDKLPGLDLWAWRYGTWVHITSRKLAGQGKT